MAFLTGSPAVPAKLANVGIKTKIPAPSPALPLVTIKTKPAALSRFYLLAIFDCLFSSFS
jgi:hypothetical protein